MTKQCDKTEEKEVLPTYFERRENGRIYVRMVMPGDLQKVTPKALHKVRLSTDKYDINEAVLVGMPLIHSTKAKWAQLRKQHDKALGASKQPKQAKYAWAATEPNGIDDATVKQVFLTPDIIDEILASRIQSWLHTDEDDRYTHGLDDEEFEELNQFCANSDAQMRSIIGRGRNSGDYGNVVELVLDWCDGLDMTVSPDDPIFIDLIRRFAETEKKMLELIVARNRGDSPTPPEVKLRSGTRLSEMEAMYREYKGDAVGHHHLGTVLSTWSLFQEFKGNVFLDDVTSGDIYDFVNFYMSEKGRKWSQGYATSKVPYYLREIFSVARTRGKMTAENPAINLEAMPLLSKKEKKSRMKPRHPLSSAHINKLLGSEWYVAGSKRWRGKLGSDLGVRYFGPLMQLLHGSRVREPLQLMLDEVLYIQEITCFAFQIEFEKDVDGEGAGFKTKKDLSAPSDSQRLAEQLTPRSLKNESTIRKIPVHPKLIELGLMDYVEQRRRELGGKNGPLFPSSAPEPGGKSPKWGRAFEQALLRFMKDDLEFADGYGNHSFRHQFEDRLREAQARTSRTLPWPLGMGHFLSGRKLLRVEDKGGAEEVGSEAAYGRGYRPASTLPYLKLLDFSDIVFPAPYLEWLGK